MKIDAVSKGIYQKSMQRYKWTEAEVVEKWELDKAVNSVWARAMLENMLGAVEARRKYPEVYAA